MPRQFLQVSPGEWKSLNGILPTGGGGDLNSGGLNRRPQVFANHGIDLPQFAFKLNLPDPQPDRMPDGGLFLGK